VQAEITEATEGNQPEPGKSPRGMGMRTEESMKEHPAEVKAYLSRLYDEERRRFACRAKSPGEFRQWQDGARPAFQQLLGLPRIAEMARGHTPETHIEEDGEDMGSYTRQRGWIDTEPGVRSRLWLLTPKASGPLPLAITPHGHENGDTYVGIWHNERSREQIEKEDQDVAVQAVERGFLTVAPATRGMGANPSSYRIADIAKRHGGTDCLCHNWQVVVTGRSMLGERVWDLMRILDWALELPGVDAGRVLMVGNSGGGMATLHTAACDERIQVAVPCCAYNNYVSPQGALRHCPCNAVPGLLDFGEYWDVAGLVAPRFLLTVNGRGDVLHPVPEVDEAVLRLKAFYRSAGAGDRYEHRYGGGGHRFYRGLMWPWIEEAMGRVIAE
jgi:dienelactone hydrolase